MEADINLYWEVKECEYKGEHYSVRDNGAVMRHAREGKKPRPLDEVWTFGSKKENGYMCVGADRVHIIVATAFHGTRDSKVYIVDHIDTNRCNNRPDNLRWLTRLENVLLNPVTLKRVTYLCGGDIRNFIKDPSCLDLKEGNQDLEWMRAVTPSEAANAYHNVMRWGQRPSTPKPVESSDDKQWMFAEPKKLYNPAEDQQTFIKATAPETALQMDWQTPSTFLCCPSDIHTATLQQYYDNLAVGKVFMENIYGKRTVEAFVYIDEGTCIAVLTKTVDYSPNPYGMLYIRESGHQFIHKSISTYKSPEGAMKAFTIAQGLPWEGGDTFDDYCD